MQDPLITIMTCLKAGWTLTGDLAVGNIQFSTGWYDSTITTPQVTVTEIMDDDEPFELGYGTVRVNAVYQVDVWVSIVKDTGKGRGKAKDHIWKMQEHVKSILKANHTGLTNIAELVLNKVGRRLDEMNLEPPILRWSKPVLVIYDI